MDIIDVSLSNKWVQKVVTVHVTRFKKFHGKGLRRKDWRKALFYAATVLLRAGVLASLYLILESAVNGEGNEDLVSAQILKSIAEPVVQYFI